MGKRILVTGGAGFIGSHLCDALIKDGNDIFCLDSFVTGSMDNISHLLEIPLFHLIEQDVTEPLDLEVEQIYNLACPASPQAYQADPVRTVRTSVMGAINMLDLARKHDALMLQASTSEVYGDPLFHPQSESYWGNVNPVGLRSCYDEGKRCAETLAMDYHREYGTDIRIVRIFNTYGPRMHEHDGRVVSNFVVQALKGEDLTVYGDGSQTRSFCYVSDLVDGLIKMMNNNNNFVGPVNLGNPSERTIADFARLILELTGSASKIVQRPLPSDDPSRRRPDITLAQKELGWSPTVDINEGLGRTVEYFTGKLGLKK